MARVMDDDLDWLDAEEFDLDYSESQEGEEKMNDKKLWKISAGFSTNYDSYAAAEEAAKRKSKDYDEVVIYEAIARVVTPVPPAEVVKL